MGRPLQHLQQFFRELKRRNVYKVAATYAVVAFVGFQAAKLLIPSTVLPAWTDEFFLFLLIIGFPVAVVVAWAFELTPEGVRRTAEADSEAPKAEAGTRTSYKILLGLGLVAAAMAGGWYLTGGGGSDPEPRLGNRSIAVLPFEALGEEEPGPFTEGMHADLRSRLSNVADLEVISRTAVQQYRGSDETTGEIARELGVRWVLEGGVQEMDDKIQVNAQLIDPRTETQAWADTYQRDLTARDLFELQGEISKRIARSLEAQLTPEETERVERRPTDDLNAYRLYVRGRSRLDTRTEAGMRQAMELFRQAIAQDSGYAPGWSGLADALNVLVSHGYASADTSLPQSFEAARRALELDPDLAEAHASLAMAHWDQLGVAAALRRLNRAVELKPSYAQAHTWLVELHGALDQPQQALQHARRAVGLNPYSPLNQLVLGWTYWWLEGPEGRAMEHVRRAVQMEPGLAVAHADEGLLLSDAGRQEEAIAAFERALERASEDSFAWRVALGGLGAAHVRAGRSDRAREILSRLDREENVEFWKAMIHAALGDEAEAFRALRNVEWGIVLGWNLRVISAFDSIREDARYQELIREINESWGLNPDGSLPEGVDVAFGLEVDD